MKGEADGLPKEPVYTSQKHAEMEAMHSYAKYLEVLGDQQANRGVTKSSETPAQRNGLTPKYPEFFGVQGNSAVPYEKIFQDGQRLKAVLDGYQELEHSAAGGVPTDVSNVIAAVNKNNWLNSQAFDTRQRESIYSGVQRDPAVNLFEINLRKRRENNLFSLY